MNITLDTDDKQNEETTKEVAKVGKWWQQGLRMFVEPQEEVMEEEKVKGVQRTKPRVGI